MKRTLLFSVAALALLTAAGPIKNAFEPGKKVTVGQVNTTLLASNDGRHGFCVKAGDSNTDTINVALSAGASATVGIPLTASQSICDPIGSEPVYYGIVSGFAITTAGTHVLFVFEK